MVDFDLYKDTTLKMTRYYRIINEIKDHLDGPCTCSDISECLNIVKGLAEFVINENQKTKKEESKDGG